MLLPPQLSTRPNILMMVCRCAVGVVSCSQDGPTSSSSITHGSCPGPSQSHTPHPDRATTGASCARDAHTAEEAWHPAPEFILSPEVAICRRTHIREGWLRHGFRFLLATRSMLLELRHRCALCNQYVARTSMMKPHYKLHHAEFMCQRHSLAMKLSHKWGVPAKTCAYCDVNSSAFRQHVQHCAPLWQWATLHVFFEFQRVGSKRGLHGCGSADPKPLWTAFEKAIRRGRASSPKSLEDGSCGSRRHHSIPAKSNQGPGQEKPTCGSQDHGPQSRGRETRIARNASLDATDGRPHAPKRDPPAGPTPGRGIRHVGQNQPPQDHPPSSRSDAAMEEDCVDRKGTSNSPLANMPLRDVLFIEMLKNMLEQLDQASKVQGLNPHVDKGWRDTSGSWQFPQKWSNM